MQIGLPTGQSMRSVWVTEEGKTFDKWQVGVDGEWVDINNTYIDIRDGIYRRKGSQKDWEDFCKKYEE